ncbi:hypothetical protein [Novosphingobium humi]|uniref:Uncharacterized protein n=1 Tax=Novosphingobium humi TaxID=2282397 RepID=A0ABY7U177_9SPHN|nr:hypothetical protein [Novosphingobium humi]WCT79278.1 hypothetical protein PQ457_19965 [Novosphingobium humi]
MGQIQRLTQDLIGVLKLAQENIAMEIVGQRIKPTPPPLDLGLQRSNMGRQHAVEAEMIALLLCKGGALVGQRIAQKRSCRAVAMQCDNILPSLRSGS